MCGVEWECELNGTGDEDDDILGMGCESAEQSKWERLAAVVDSGAAENVLPASVCNHVKQLSATCRSDVGMEPAERESAITIRGFFFFFFFARKDLEGQLSTENYN